jgi:hypothetical protein
VAQQESGPPRFPPGPAPGTPGPGRSDASPDPDEELPSWVIPAPVRPPRRHRSAPRRLGALRRPGAGPRHGEPLDGGRPDRDGLRAGDGARHGGVTHEAVRDGEAARDSGAARDREVAHDGGAAHDSGAVRDGEGARHGREARRDGDGAGPGGDGAGPGGDGAGPGGDGGLRLPFGRARAARARRARRRLHLWGALASGAAVIAVLIYVLLPAGASSPAGADRFVTTYLPGEYRSVPNTCESVSAATLSRYLPGKPTRAALPGLSGNSGSQCDWTLDHKPEYRLLQVTAHAYAPSGLASGNGSATSAAKDAYAQDLQAKTNPLRSTRQPPARITTMHGLGTVAFSAFQVIKAGGDTTDRVTVVARIRNALVIVAFSGLDHARQGGYGPASPGELAAGAVAAARDVLAKIG